MIAIIHSFLLKLGLAVSLLFNVSSTDEGIDAWAIPASYKNLILTSSSDKAHSLAPLSYKSRICEIGVGNESICHSSRARL